MGGEERARSRYPLHLMPNLPAKHSTPKPNRTHVPKGSWGQGRGGRPWRRLRDQILRRDCYLCQPCRRNGHVTEAAEVDHIVNVARGGTDDPSNLESTCHECHVAKTLVESGQKPKQPIGVDGWPVEQQLRGR